MAVEGTSGLAVGAAAGGIVLIWSGLTGRKVTDTLRSVASGKTPPGPASSLGITASFDASSGGTSSGSSSGGATPANASESAFITAMLSDLGAPATPANINSVSSWFKHEEPSFPPPNAYNPLNIEVGAGKFAQYSSAAAGAQATASFIRNNGYNQIYMNLKSGNGICGSGMASDFSKWSGGGYSSVC
jgi:hypothetical protein